MASCAWSESARRARRRGLVLLVVAGLLWGGAGLALEPRRETFDQANARGLAAYEARRYEEALAEFQAAYSLRQLPGVLYNIAQTHRRLGNARKALETYELYLRADAKADVQTKAQVRGYIEQMRALLEGAPGQAADIHVVAPVPLIEPTPPLVSDGGSEQQGHAAQPARPVYRRWWFWTSIGAAALTAVGVGLGVGLGSKPGAAVSVPQDNLRVVTF